MAAAPLVLIQIEYIITALDMLCIARDKLIEQLAAVISLPNGYSVLAKSKKYLTLYHNLKEATSFLDGSAKARER